MKAEMSGQPEKLVGKYFHSANETNKIEWQGVVIGGPHPRLVSGATVRMGFRGPKRAKTCANRKDDQLGILSRCARDDVWLKTFTTSNHRNSASRMRGLSLCFCRRIRPLAMPKPARAQKAGDVHALLSASLDCSDQSYVGSLVLIHFIENATLIVICTAIIIAQRLGKGDSPRTREFVALPGIYFVSGSP